ncbi:MAG: hypothetical protein AAEJ57_01095, partial [Opitutales bacterium]
MTRFGLLFFALISGLGSDHLAAKSLEKAFRRPVALAWTSDGLLAVANRDTGSISLIEVEKRKVVGEFVVGKRLSSLSSLSGGRFLVATDEEANQLLLLESKGSTVSVRDRVTVPHSPVNALVSSDNSFAVVASLWARQVSLIRVDLEQGDLSRERVTDLPFPPRLQWM